MEVNWFPGHMTKAFRQIKEYLKLVDMIIETCDARIPNSSRNPEISKLIDKKPRLIIMNKADLADATVTQQFVEFNKANGNFVLAHNALIKDGLNQIQTLCEKICQDKIQRLENKGRMNYSIKAMVLGIPNTGKSTLINALSKKKAVQTSDRPGVTRAPQWVRSGNIELLDMPGVLWPKLGSQESMLSLAATGAVKDAVFDIEEIAFLLLKKLLTMYPDLIMERYKLSGEDLSMDIYDLFQHICRKRGYILSGGRLDLRRFSIIFVDEFRAGKIGRITLERLN